MEFMEFQTNFDFVTEWQYMPSFYGKNMRMMQEELKEE